MEKIYKTSFNLTQTQIDIIVKISEEKGISKTDVLRQAIVNHKFFYDIEKNGGNILIEEKDKTLKHVIFR